MNQKNLYKAQDKLNFSLILHFNSTLEGQEWTNMLNFQFYFEFNVKFFISSQLFYFSRNHSKTIRILFFYIFLVL